MEKLISRPQRNLWFGVLFGLGVAAFIDEVVFHQLLAWHHFYDKSSMAIGLVSDGLFHAFSWFATVASLFLLADVKRRNSFWIKRWISGMLLGLGFFQLYDGLIQHKLFRIHQIRYKVNVLPYDIAWNAVAIIVLIVGFIIFIQTQKYIRRKRG
ncbi:DUF2243 domain-containing protein [Staphylococcus pseudoxylosus]|uniref:DUF2243 domain-containing protein n=1 Tax=Staphylococcus pseudoxylosus TaxID=2282419 RepID=UPI002DBC4D6D|nr:DUF2243 domain-containing protein [Staphylococcus pseudoxylosus]MEB7754446.1 DUF2243 domain-containing protein [Staphylococcus pseudoxylosus]